MVLQMIRPPMTTLRAGSLAAANTHLSQLLSRHLRIAVFANRPSHACADRNTALWGLR